MDARALRAGFADLAVARSRPSRRGTVRSGVVQGAAEMSARARAANSLAAHETCSGGGDTRARVARDRDGARVRRGPAGVAVRWTGPVIASIRSALHGFIRARTVYNRQRAQVPPSGVTATPSPRSRSSLPSVPAAASSNCCGRLLILAVCRLPAQNCCRPITPDLSSALARSNRFGADSRANDRDLAPRLPSAQPGGETQAWIDLSSCVRTASSAASFRCRRQADTAMASRARGWPSVFVSRDPHHVRVGSARVVLIDRRRVSLPWSEVFFATAFVELFCRFVRAWAGWFVGQGVIA